MYDWKKERDLVVKKLQDTSSIGEFASELFYSLSSLVAVKIVSELRLEMSTDLEGKLKYQLKIFEQLVVVLIAKLLHEKGEKNGEFSTNRSTIHGKN